MRAAILDSSGAPERMHVDVQRAGGGSRYRAVHREGEPPGDGDAGGRDGAGRPQLLPAAGGIGPPLEVRLRREFKGLTVRDLLADAGIDEQLPGAVRTALAEIERGDFAAAEATLPGRFAPLLPFPGSEGGSDRRRRARWIALLALATAAATATILLL